VFEHFFRSLAPAWHGVVMIAPALGVIIALHLALLPLLVLARIVGVRPAPVWRYLDKLASSIEAISRATGMGVAWVALLMVIVQFVVVAMSYVFSIGYIWLQESVVYMHALLFLTAAAFTLLEDGHVRVDVFFREAGEKQKAVTDFLGAYLFLLPVVVMIGWLGYPFVTRSWAYFEGSQETSGIQAVYLLKTFILLFAGLMLLQGYASAIRAAERLFGLGGVSHEPAVGPEV
jgi:TRAP-type mannitol/chloroaromatic compound transport system permease small subunit